MTLEKANLPKPFDSDHALRTVGRIAVESARLELHLAMMRNLTNPDDTRPVTQLVALNVDDNAREISRAVAERHWLPGPGGHPLQTAITDWAVEATALLKERGDLMHSTWFNSTVDGVETVVAGHSRTGNRQPVTVHALEDLSRRIGDACTRFTDVYFYALLHNGTPTRNERQRQDRR